MLDHTRLVALLSALVFAHVALAQEAQPQEDDAGTAVPQPPIATGLVAPQLVTFVPASLPDHLVLPAQGVAVTLELTVESDGTVSAAAVSDDTDLALDATLLTAVTDAATQLRFAPATRDGQPIAARVRFVYRIDPPPPPPALAESPPPAPPEPTRATNAAGSEDVVPAASYSATARTEAPPREVTVHQLSAQQVGRVAGTRGDSLRAVEILPGVARPPLNDGQVIVRGASPQDTQVLVEGTPVLFLYHLGGLTSFFNSSLLERVDFYPGNFSARFGRAIGGVIDVDVRSPKRDRAHGTLDVNLIDASLLVEAPINENAGFTLAARRSYIDFFFDSVVPDDAFDVVAAPVYWDYQGVGEYRLTERDRLRLQAFGSKDQMHVVTGKADNGDPRVRGNLGFSSEFHRALLSWQHDYGDGARHDVMIGGGFLNIDAQIGELVDQHISVPTIFSRAEWHLPLGSSLSLDTGWDVVGYRGRVTYDGPRFRTDEGSEDVDAPVNVSLNQVATVVRPALFAELSWTPHESLRVIPGVRVDYTSEVQDVTIDPRLVTRWSVTDDTVLKAGVGRFSQPPELGAAFPQLGNPDVLSASAVHVSAGVEQRVGEDLKLGVEGYGKYLWDLPVNSNSGPSPVNQGEGRIYGVEVSARYQRRKTFGYLAYTLSRSERSVRGGPYRLHNYDQPHILNVSGGHDLGRGWDVSGTLRLVSGNPETPITGAVYNANTDEHLPVYGPLNSARAPLFYRLDLRIQKRWEFGDAKLSLYLDLINATNAQITEVTDYGFDYRTQSGVSGFPLLPVLGVRGEI